MLLRVWRFITLLLAALALTMESAHVLELPQKMRYDAQMYAAVNTTLYRYFAMVGGVYQVGSIVAAAVIAGNPFNVNNFLMISVLANMLQLRPS